MAFVLRNIENKRFVEVAGDGSEGLVTLMTRATIFSDLPSVQEGFTEHDKWVGPLEIVEIEMGVKP